MEQSVKADQFWAEIQTSELHRFHILLTITMEINLTSQKGDGVVSVPTEWATRLDLAPSLPSPDNPDHSIYQVDLFHSLHCLVSLTVSWWVTNVLI